MWTKKFIWIEIRQITGKDSYRMSRQSIRLERDELKELLDHSRRMFLEITMEKIDVNGGTRETRAPAKRKQEYTGGYTPPVPTLRRVDTLLLDDDGNPLPVQTRPSCDDDPFASFLSTNELPGPPTPFQFEKI
jgi:hypothetical protein